MKLNVVNGDIGEEVYLSTDLCLLQKKEHTAKSDCAQMHCDIFRELPTQKQHSFFH